MITIIGLYSVTNKKDVIQSVIAVLFSIFLYQHRIENNSQYQIGKYVLLIKTSDFFYIGIQ